MSEFEFARISASFTEITLPEQRVYQGAIFPLCLTLKHRSDDSLSSSSSSSSPSPSPTTSTAVGGTSTTGGHEGIIGGGQEPMKLDDFLASLRRISGKEVEGGLDDVLRKHRGILFRDCGVFDAQSFHQAIEATGYAGMAYVGGAAVRTQLTERVFTANESPSTEKIPFHHEMAQTPDPPTHLFFFCETPPSEGGETPILVSNEVYSRLADLHPSFIQSLERNGVRYVRYMPEEDDPTSAIGRGWKSTFLTDSKEGAEEALRSLGSSWEWAADGTLKTVTAVVPAVRVDDKGEKRSGQKTFFNSVVAAYTGWNDSRNQGERAVVLGEDVEEEIVDRADSSSSSSNGGEAVGEEKGVGRLLDPLALQDAVRVMDEVSVAIQWRKGDIMLLDNRTVMHSRRPFVGPRRVLASLVRDPSR